MDDKDIIFLDQILYNANKDYVVSQLKNIDNSLILHYFAANYNWNNGFDIPTTILENEACDLGRFINVLLCRWLSFVREFR